MSRGVVEPLQLAGAAAADGAAAAGSSDQRAVPTCRTAATWRTSNRPWPGRRPRGPPQRRRGGAAVERPRPADQLRPGRTGPPCSRRWRASRSSTRLHRRHCRRPGRGGTAGRLRQGRRLRPGGAARGRRGRDPRRPGRATGRRGRPVDQRHRRPDPDGSQPSGWPRLRTAPVSRLLRRPASGRLAMPRRRTPRTPRRSRARPPGVLPGRSRSELHRQIASSAASASGSGWVRSAPSTRRPPAWRPARL